MRPLNFTFAVFLIVNLLRMGAVMAQDRISNNNGFGDYTGGSTFQNVIINNTLNEPLLFAPGTENEVTNNNGGVAANLLGGSNCEINDGEELPAAYNLLYGNLNTINSSSATIITGTGNTSELVSSSAAIGEENTLTGRSNVGEQDLNRMFAIGKENSINETDAGFAIGHDNEVNGGILDVDNLYAIGSRTENFNSESMVLGFGSEDDRLGTPGSRSIALGTYNENTGETFKTLNINPPSTDTSFTAPLVGIGTDVPDAKLNIVNRGATVGESDTPGVAFRIDEVGNIGNTIERFSVRNDGATSFNLPARPDRPRAPYQFEESNFPIFQDPENPGRVDGEANIVQNYNNFPAIQEGSKWLGLGERPPGDGTIQVAYGLANVWEDNAANLILLDQDPDRQSGSSPTKDAAITFQDAKDNGEELKDDKGENRLRFLFRNGKDIEESNSTFELMSLEPTGEVAVGDYSGSVTPDAQLEVKGDPNDNISTLFEVLEGGSSSSRGTEV